MLCVKGAESSSPDSAVNILPTLDAGPTDAESLQFADVGSGQKTRLAKSSSVTHGISGSGETVSAVSQPFNGQSMITHHHYHHYDVECSLCQRQGRTTTLGILCAFVVILRASLCL